MAFWEHDNNVNKSENLFPYSPIPLFNDVADSDELDAVYGNGEADLSSTAK
ncbi:hypothetical protein [Salinimonas chungwhensis]|uniref:hypothetical protein n=1 Tax=Salinimonas chungwhensis TaxID=265425 RepID=UPI00035CB668|nr:hypothetical protein [Salinimonas chungwhensis]